MADPVDDRMHIAVTTRSVDPVTGRFVKVQKALCGEPLGGSYLLRYAVKLIPPAERKEQLCARCNARFT